MNPDTVSIVTSPDETELGAASILQSFMQEQETRSRVSRQRRDSIVQQIFRGEGQALANSPSYETEGRTLAEMANQLDSDFYLEINDSSEHINSLEQRPENRLLNLETIIRGVFHHGITAGHVISLFQFGYLYVHRIFNDGVENAEEICRQIIAKIVDYIKKYVVVWVRSLGGWSDPDLVAPSGVGGKGSTKSGANCISHISAPSTLSNLLTILPFQSEFINEVERFVRERVNSRRVTNFLTDNRTVAAIAVSVVAVTTLNLYLYLKR
eukprot:sb/3468238/